jgi:hypothetical protein
MEYKDGQCHKTQHIEFKQQALEDSPNPAAKLGVAQELLWMWDYHQVKL